LEGEISGEAQSYLYIHNRTTAVRYRTENIYRQLRNHSRNRSPDFCDVAHSECFAILHAMMRLWLSFR